MNFFLKEAVLYNEPLTSTCLTLVYTTILVYTSECILLHLKAVRGLRPNHITSRNVTEYSRFYY